MLKKLSLFFQRFLGFGLAEQTANFLETENKQIEPILETENKQIEPILETEKHLELTKIVHKFEENVKAEIKKGLTDLPNTGIRSSVDNNQNLINGLHNLVLPEYGLEWLPVLNTLSILHHDFSKAVQNILDLANTPYTISFQGVSEAKAAKMKSFLEKEKKRIFSDCGETVFINTLIRQIAVFGALSTEVVVTNDMRKVKEVVFVPNQDIRYVYENGAYNPYQQVRTALNAKTTANGYQKLNRYTYKYFPILKDGSVPYGIPPFISALEATGIERDMIKNFASLMKRLGMFGFLEVLLSPPEMQDGESEEEYIRRLSDIAKIQGSSIANNLNDGHVIGFEGMQQFKMNGNDTNGKGQSELLDIVSTLLITGLKQDPNLLGRHTTVTETFGKVLLTLMIAQTQTYQAVVANFLDFLYTTILKLEGFQFDDLSVTFSKPNVTDELKDEQTKEVRIKNLTALFMQGIITQTQFAQEMGYNKPALEVPPTSSTQTTNTANALSGIKKKSKNLSFDYRLPDNYKDETFIDWGNDKKAQSFADNYIKSIDTAYNKAIKRVVDKAESGLKKGITQKDFIKNAEKAFSNWDLYFKVDKTTTKSTKNAYMWYRSDKSIFPAKKNTQSQSHSFDVPNVVLDLSDKRAMEFLAQLDKFYLGKFISDDDTKKRILDFLNKFYLENGEAIGDNREMIKKFKETFTSTLELEGWKIRRIIDTSVNRLRAWGNINYMAQAQEKNYEIVEVMDRITCPHCRAMNARIFSVKNAQKQIKNTIDSGIDKDLPPFITTLPIADVESAKSTDLESKGFLMPPFHPHCRGRLVVN